MLGFKEKRELQKVIAANLESLSAGDLPFAEKRRLQKGIQDAFAKLNAAVDAAPEKAEDNQMLADLIAGKFNDELPERFLKILKQIIDEIKDVGPVKQPTIAYIEVNKEKVGAIMESAVEEVFGKLWGKSGPALT